MRDAPSVTRSPSTTADAHVGQLGTEFWAFAPVGGRARSVVTHQAVALLALRNFAVGVAFTNTDCAGGAVVHGPFRRADRAAGMGRHRTRILGVLWMSSRAKGGTVLSRAIVYGLLGEGLCGLSAIYHGPALTLGDDPAFLRAIETLACVTTSQTFAMSLWVRLFKAGQLTRVFASWRRTIWVCVTGILGSLFWLFGFDLQNAAYVRAFGRVEMVFIVLVSILVF